MPNQKGFTKSESWSINKLTLAFDDIYEGKTKLKMPIFQRGVVWAESKQADLIRSIKLGFPIGSLLFYSLPQDSQGIQTNLLIDGLQRTTAIRNYQSKPLSYMDVEDLDERAIEAFHKALVIANEMKQLPNELSSALDEWMDITKTLKLDDGFDPNGLIKVINQQIKPEKPFVLDDNVLLPATRKFLTSIHDLCDIGDISVPVLIYDGPESNLPDIYEKINATGTRLTKYEIFAASWVKQNIKILNEDVLSAIQSRYKSLMTGQNIAISGVNDDGKPESLSLFDYLFGLGKVLSDKYPLLFVIDNNPTSMESVAFVLATIFYGLRYTSMKDLPDEMDRDELNSIDVSRFETALFESTEFVYQTLKPYINIKLNSESSTSRIVHTELQIASMICRAFSGKYNIESETWEDRDGAEEDRALLKVTLPQHYLIDILSQNWRGSGDTRLFLRTWNTNELDDGKILLSPSSHYITKLRKEEFERVLDQWFADQLRLNQKNRSYVTSAVRALMKILYVTIVTVHEENIDSFELDHIYPVSRLIKLISKEETEEGWPISAISNLALFDWKTNREKSMKTLPEYIQTIPSSEQPEKIEKIKKYLFYPIEKTGINQTDGKDDYTKEDFLDFLGDRFNEIKKIVISTLKIED